LIELISFFHLANMKLSILLLKR